MRILGIVLLSLLGLVILLLVLILFVPYTYRLAGSCHDKQLRLHGRVFVLAGLFGVAAGYDDSGLKLYLRIIGIKKNLLKNDEDEADDEGNSTEKVDDASPETKISEKNESVATAPKNEKAAKPGEPQKAESSVKTVQTAENEPETDVPKEDKPSLVSKIKGFFTGLRDKITNIRENINSLKKKAHKIKKEIADERNRQAVCFILGKLLNLLKHLSPRRTKLDLKFSTGSPDTTGEVVGVLAIFPFAYKKSWRIAPDFTADEAYAETDFMLCGHIYGITILTTAIQILCDKGCRRLYKKIT
jgi:hypothetical protein